MWPFGGLILVLLGLLPSAWHWLTHAQPGTLWQAAACYTLIDGAFALAAVLFVFTAIQYGETRCAGSCYGAVLLLLLLLLKRTLIFDTSQDNFRMRVHTATCPLRNVGHLHHPCIAAGCSGLLLLCLTCVSCPGASKGQHRTQGPGWNTMATSRHPEALHPVT